MVILIIMVIILIIVIRYVCIYVFDHALISNFRTSLWYMNLWSSEKKNRHVMRNLTFLYQDMTFVRALKHRQFEGGRKRWPLSSAHERFLPRSTSAVHGWRFKWSMGWICYIIYQQECDTYWLYVCMYLSMYVCIYLSMYVCIYVSMYLCIYVSMYLCIYVPMYLCIYVCMHAWMYACMHVCLCVCMHACMYVCMHACMYLGR